MSVWAPRLNHAWRVLATGSAFFLFGVGGVLMSITVFPLVRAVSWNAESARRRLQYTMHISWRLFVGYMRAVGILTWEVHGRERLLQPGRLVIANHPSLLDVVFLISMMPSVDCIVKRGIFRNPFMRWPAQWAGYIPNHDAEQLVNDSARALRQGRSLLMFPEGTRTTPGQPVRLKRGAAQIALAAEAEILPAVITVNPTTLTKGEPWYRVPPTPFHVTITVGAPVSARRFVAEAPSRPQAARQLTEYFERHLTDAVAQQAKRYNFQP